MKSIRVLLDKKAALNVKSPSKAALTKRSYSSMFGKANQQDDDLIFSHPDSNYRFAWELFVFVMMLYFLFMIPIRIAVELSRNSYILDYIGDFVILVDAYLRYAYLPMFSGGILVTEKAKLSDLYFANDFKLDFLTCFPYDIFALIYLHSPELPS